MQASLPETVLAWMYIGGGDEDDSACVVSEEVAQELRAAFLAHRSDPERQVALQGGHEGQRLRGRCHEGESSSPDSERKVVLQGRCKDPECPLNKNKAVNLVHLRVVDAHGHGRGDAKEVLVVDHE